MIVEIVGAYVEGLPIPNSSSFLTRVASENLYGAFENDWVTNIFLQSSLSPTFKSGNNSSLFSLSPLSSLWFKLF